MTATVASARGQAASTPCWSASPSTTTSAFATLKYTENDVEELAEVLQQPEAGFDRPRADRAARQGEQGDAPTAANVRKALDELLAEAEEGRHGADRPGGARRQLEVKDPDGKGEPKTYPYFCPADADLLDPRYSDGHSDTMVNLDDLFDQLGKCGAGTKLVLMDACRNELTVKAGRRSLDARSVSIPDGVAALFSCRPRAVRLRDGEAGQGARRLLPLRHRGTEGQGEERRGRGDLGRPGRATSPTR